MRTSAAALLVAVVVLAYSAPAAEEIEGIDWNVDAVLESVYLPRSGALDWTFEAGLSLDVDLGRVVGLDNWYVFAHPTLAWGVEESYGWTARAYLAWLSWDGSDYWNVLAGLYDLGWHFQSLPSTLVFTRLPGENIGSFSPGAIGLLDPFPLSAPGARLELKPRENWAVQFASIWLEERHNLASHQLAPGSERWLLIAETSWLREGTEENGYQHLTAGLGGWVLPGAKVDDSRRTPLGVYAFGDTRIWSEAVDPEQGLSTFVTVSVAQYRSGPWDKRAVGGVEWIGVIPHRNHDITSLAIIAEETSGPSRNDRRGWSVATELLHRVVLGDHAYVQASAQWRSPLSGEDPDERWKLGLSIGFSL